MPQLTRGANSRLERLSFEAGLRATPEEQCTLETLLAEVRRGVVGVPQAEFVLSRYIAHQHEREGS